MAAADADGFVSRKGLLVKSGEATMLGNAFRRRWMELERGAITYWADEGARMKGKKPKGSIQLSADTKLSKEAGGADGEGATKFQIMAESGRIYILIAETTTSMMGWLEAVKTNISALEAAATGGGDSGSGGGGRGGGSSGGAGVGGVGGGVGGGGGAASAAAGRGSGRGRTSSAGQPAGGLSGGLSTKQGEMWKKGHVRRNWQLRYFVLSHGVIRYYEGDAAGTELGAVSIRGPGPCILQVQPEALAKTGKSGSTEWRFELRTPTGTLVCAAMDEAGMDAWVGLIRRSAATYAEAAEAAAADAAAAAAAEPQTRTEPARSSAMVEMMEAGGAKKGGKGTVKDDMKELQDPNTGKKYWYNAATGQTAWTKEGLTPAMQSLAASSGGTGGATTF
jgi:hypothetical protein